MGVNEKILVVEDNRSICELIEMNLLMAGFARVYTASNGERGLAVARQECPNLIILDIMLPGMNGWAVCRALKEDSATAGIPVIILTAKGEEQDIVYGLELGAVDYVTKPFSNKVLIARVKAQLRNKNDSPKNDVVSLDGLYISNSEHIAKIPDRVHPSQKTEYFYIVFPQTFPTGEMIDAGFSREFTKSVHVFRIGVE